MLGSMASTLLTAPTGKNPGPQPLDREQQDAVDHIDGPCLVLAGPGSGKTRVIVERFLALVRRDIPPERQLVLTYTRRAADEMRARAEDGYGAFSSDAPLTNYHSFALRVVREWGWLAGVSPALRIADAAERWMHVEAVLAELRPASLWNPLRPQDVMDPLLEVIGTAKQELVAPDAYALWAQARLEHCDAAAQRVLLERQAEVAEVYARLDERYRSCGVFDFDDCILYAERLIREQPPVREAVAGTIRYVMVDEYQDTNYAQARLVETLVASHHNLLVVADDDQSIYKFRGASRANLDRFVREYPDHHAVVLRHNYRSTSPIVAASQALIGAAAPATRIEKDLVAERGRGGAVEIWGAPDERSEVMAVARECRDLIEAGTRPADIAWLFRQHVDMQPAMHALRQAGVPYQVAGGRGFFQEREIKDAFALLAAVDDPDDSLALLRCLTFPVWNLSMAGRRALAQAADEHDVPLATLLLDARVDGVNDAEHAYARRCLEDILELHAMAGREDVRDVFFAAIERAGYLGVVDEQVGAARLQMGANLNKFGELLETFADWSDDRRISTALRYLQILRDSRDAAELAAIEPIQDGVVLLTAHGAKGLEWPVVFIARCTERRWQGRTKSSADLQLPDELVPEPPPPGDAAVDEERRLFYVAASRARDRLVFTWARRYPQSFSDEACTPFLAPAPAGTDAARQVDVPLDATVLTRPRRREGQPLPARMSIGVSDLRTFKQCPRRYAYQRLLRLPTRSTAQTWYGTLIHDVLRTAAVQRSTGTHVGPDEIAVLWQEAWTVSRGPKGKHPDLRVHGEEQLRRYVASPSWTEASISSVEQPVVINLDSARVSGRFDRVDTRGDGAVTVVDYKTGRPHDERSLRSDLQLRAYAVGLAQIEKSDDVAVEFHFLQSTEVVRVVADRKFLNTAFNHLSAAAREMTTATQQGAFPPKPSPWNCPRCEFRTVCDEGRAVSP